MTAADAPVAAAGDALGERGGGVVPPELRRPSAQVVAQHPDLALQLVHAVLPEPLERRVRLGHEAADRRGAARLLRVLAADLHDLAGQLGDAERVLVHLGGDPDEEVQLHPLPPLRVRALDRGVEVVVGDELVDHLADAPRAALGREREPGAADLLDLAGDADGERVDPQRRQRQADVAAALLLVHEVGDETVDPREVGGRQRGERDLVVAGAAEAVAHHRAHLLGGPLADRAGDHPGLAEAAPARAAAEDLDVEAVVHHLDERHELVLRVRPLRQVGDGALVDALGHLGEARRAPRR